MKRGGAEAPRENQVAEKILGCAIEIHKILGPGLLESAYEQCLCFESSQCGLPFRRLNFKNIRLDWGYVMDLVVEDLMIMELKIVGKLLPVYPAQFLTYLRLYQRCVGLLSNFNVPGLNAGIKRIVNQFNEASASPHISGGIRV